MRPLTDYELNYAADRLTSDETSNQVVTFEIAHKPAGENVLHLNLWEEDLFPCFVTSGGGGAILVVQEEFIDNPVTIQDLDSPSYLTGTTFNFADAMAKGWYWNLGHGLELDDVEDLLFIARVKVTSYDPTGVNKPTVAWFGPEEGSTLWVGDIEKYGTGEYIKGSLDITHVPPFYNIGISTSFAIPGGGVAYYKSLFEEYQGYKGPPEKPIDYDALRITNYLQKLYHAQGQSALSQRNKALQELLERYP